jgi:hypothetical protein
MQTLTSLRNIGSVFIMAVICSWSSAAWPQAKTAVEITDEPHHNLLLKNDQVCVFDVDLRRNDQALVRHKYNFLVVTLTSSEVVMWPEGSSDIQSFNFPKGDVRFYFGDRTIGVRNEHADAYHNITVEFLDPKVTTYGYQGNLGKWTYGDSVLRWPTDPHAKFNNSIHFGTATAADIQLLQGDSYPVPEKEAAELLIAVSDIDLRTGYDTHIRKSAGEVLWIGPGRKDKYLNATPDPARFVIIELH